MLRKKVRTAIGQALIAGLLIIIGLGPTQAVTYGQTGKINWSAPISFERTGWFPDITSDATGRVHIAWSNSVINAIRGGTGSERQGFDVVLYTSSTNGVDWEPINEIAALREPVVGNVEVTRPALLVDKEGYFHMTFRDINVWYSHAPAALAADARSWEQPVQVNSNEMAYFSRLAEDSKGRLHMVYTEAVPTSECLICYHVQYRYSDDEGKTWSTETDISVIPTGAVKTTILIDGKDNVHVVWEAGRGGTLGHVVDPTSVMYTVSYNRGLSWSNPIELVAPEGERSHNVTIGQDGDGNLVTAWLSLPDDMVYYAVSMDNGLSWSTPAPIPGIMGAWANYSNRLDTYSMATDSAGNLHMVLVGRATATDEKLTLYHMTWDGTAWLAPDAIVSYTGDTPEWPRIAISNGNQLNVTWFVRPEDFVWAAAGDYYKIWFSRARVNAPYIASQDYPPVSVDVTETPTVEPTLPAETPYPTPVPLNVSLPEEAISQDTVSEVGQLNLLLRALIPAAVLTGGLLAVILIRKRW